jgi:glutathione S-transferase
MEAMSWVVIVTALALIQFHYFGIMVGKMRAKHAVSAPETVGDPEFMRMFRVHQNTLEQLIVFIPGLWMFAHYFNPLWAAGIGLVFIVSRFVYFTGYVNDPKSRGRGFVLGFLSQAILVGGAIFGAIRALL